MQIRWYLKRLLCEYMNLLAHRTENYFLMLKVLTLQLAKNAKNTNFYFQPLMFWLSQHNTPTLDTVSIFTKE